MGRGRTKAVVPKRSTPITPSASLSDEAVRVFDFIVRSVSPDHFSDVDRPLLESYATAIVNARRAQEAIDRDGQVTPDGKVSPWVGVLEKQIRNIVALVMRLRLAPQSRFDRLKAGTTMRPQDREYYEGEHDPDDPRGLLAKSPLPKPGTLAWFRAPPHLRQPHPDDIEDDDRLLA